jgi:hypothetical protein
MWNKWIVLTMLSASLSAQKVKPNLYFGVDSKSFSTNGRWMPSDFKDKAAYPSETEIDCDRQSKTCVEATAEYFSGHPHVSLTYFEVVKWDENGIMATSASGICMTETMLISFSDKTITDTHSIKKLNDDKKEACKFLGASGTETDIFVIKNSDRWNADPYGESATKY